MKLQYLLCKGAPIVSYKMTFALRRTVHRMTRVNERLYIIGTCREQDEARVRKSLDVGHKATRRLSKYEATVATLWFDVTQVKWLLAKQAPHWQQSF